MKNTRIVEELVNARIYRRIREKEANPDLYYVNEWNDKIPVTDCGFSDSDIDIILKLRSNAHLKSIKNMIAFFVIIEIIKIVVVLVYWGSISYALNQFANLLQM